MQNKVTKLQRIVIAYPSGNTTALVFDALPILDRKALNRRIIEAWGGGKRGGPGGVEQCALITKPNDSAAVARVEMFGGEFCGNATRAAAWAINGGRNGNGMIESSGVSRPLRYEIKDGVVGLEMPLFGSANFIQKTAEGYIIGFEGITQLVVIDPRAVEMPRGLLIDILQTNKYKFADQPCVGVSFYNQSREKAAFCVWVRDVATMFDETACGSGSCAIGVALAVMAGRSRSVRVVQPSGEGIVVNATVDERTKDIKTATITGGVSPVYDGELDLN